MSTSPDFKQTLTPSTLWLMAICCGLGAGANYFNQPLLHSIQQHFEVSAAQAQLTVTFAQVSYALGLLFLVPLGDILKRHILIPVLFGMAGVGMLISGFAQNIYMLWLGTAITGLFSIASQVLVPLAASLADPKKTGSVIAFLMAGLLIGIYVSTAAAGLLSNLFAWNTVYLLSALLCFVLTFLLAKKLPVLQTHPLNYGSMLKSMLELIKTEKRLLIRAGIGAFAFGSMTTLFSTMALLYSQAPFHLSDFQIGLIGTVGVFGALCAPKIGKLADQGLSKVLTLTGVTILLTSWIALYSGQWSVLAFLLGFTAINLAIPILHITNMNLIYKLREDAKTRLNSIYMTLYFIGAAGGSMLGIFGWNQGGWVMTCAIGLSLALCCLACVLLDQFLFGSTKKMS